ncbi:MAG: tRNA lysidine(34) synthetase TilS [Candidatus Pelagibacter sp.]|nr:tRNA lysidine(34) synthetase TilS [Candidatus Pelagibacter sp.]|tara:strand:- start:2839 stop:3861 length:1023 start_codon:yes stop_codon:yes gene_type:complete
MKRKNLNAAKLKNVIIKDKKISSIYLRLKSILSKQKKNNLIAVAVSGGPDSMALALLTKTLMYEKKYKVHFLLVDHGIRKNSTKEALNVKNILEKKEIKLKVLKNYKKISSNIQKNARDIRYNLLIEYCKKNKIKSILTAHHKEDQIETFLIRLSRGSGVEGLSSMSQSMKLKYGIKLIRPFLDFKKNEINQVSRKFFKKTIKDPSNKNKKFLRTNIRELTKILEKKGLNLDQVIRSIKNISSSKEAINFYVNRSLKKFVKFRKNETILDLKMFHKEPKEIKFKIINTIVKERALSYYPPRSEKVLNLISRFEANNPKKCTLGGCIFEKKKNQLHVTREF